MRTQRVSFGALGAGPTLARPSLVSPSESDRLLLDPTIKVLLDENRQALLRLLLGEAAPRVDQILDPVLPSTERRCDALMLVADDEGPYVLHLEFQSHVDTNMPTRILGYAARVLETHQLPVRSVVVYLVAPGPGTNIPNAFVMRWRNQVRVRVDYEVVCLWDIEADQATLRTAPGLLSLAPLLKGAVEADLPRLAGHVIAGEWATRTKAEVVSLLALFGARRFGRQVLTLLTEKLPMLQDVILESPFYHMLRDMIREEILAEGIAEGIAQGKAEGIAQGKAEGIAQGKAEGIAQGKAEAVLAVLAGRGLAVAPDQRARVMACTDVELLDQWLVAAVTADSASDVLGPGNE